MPSQVSSSRMERYLKSFVHLFTLFPVTCQEKGWLPPTRTCSQLQLSGRFDHSDRSASLPDGCCISKRYNFVYVRQAGKLGGTTVEKSYLLPTICAANFHSPPSNKTSRLFGGARVPEGCEKYLQVSGLLDCKCNERIHEIPPKISFLVVRHPFARFISIHKYVLEAGGGTNFTGMSAFLKTYAHGERGMVGRDKFGRLWTGIDLFYGHSAGSSHWAQQMIHVLPVCRYLPNTSLIPAEFNILQNLQPVVRRINVEKTASLPALPDPRLSTSRNTLLYDCPWQCYYELCGRSCFDLVSKWYDLDIMTLDAAGIYPAPHSITELWSVAAPSNWSAVSNRKRACELSCRW